MGLQEKRARKAAEEGWLPQRQKELGEITAQELIPYEIDWDSFEGDAKGIEWLEHNGPQQVSMALREICRDDLGKEAIREALAKVVLRNVGEIAAKSLAFDSGALTLCCAFAQSPQGRFKHTEIRACLEAAL